MDTTKKLLILSIHQDLHVLSKICKEISLNLENDQVQSWLLPSKFSSDIAEFEIKYDVKDMYVGCLEMVIDRIHYLCNLIIKYINAKYNHKNEENKYLKTATTLTLGTAVSLIWKNVQIIPTVVPTMKNLMENSDDKHTQTEEVSRNRCDSCGFAVLCIKSLYSKIQHVVKEMKIEAEKGEKIYDVTQAGCMNKITSIIEKVFEKVLMDYKNTETKCTVLEEKLFDTQNSLEKSNKELNELIKLREQLSENLQQLKSDYEDVIQIKNHFYHNILNKNKLIDELNVQLNTLKQENESHKKENDELKATTFLFSSERDFWKKRFEDLKAETESLKLHSEHLKIKMCNTEREIDNLRALLKNSEIKISKNTQRFESTSSIYEDLHNKIEQIYALIATNKNETLSEILQSNQNYNSIDGDPVKDMKSEIDYNNGIIEKLSERNKKLLTVIDRLQNMKKRL